MVKFINSNNLELKLKLGIPCTLMQKIEFKIINLGILLIFILIWHSLNIN